KSASLPEMPRFYAVINPSLFEQKWIANKILKTLPKSDVIRFTSESETVTALADELAVESLISVQKVVIFEGIEKVKKGGFEPLTKALLHSSKNSYLILTGTSAKLHSEILKDMVILDLSLEKPWERKTRIEKSVIAYFAKEQKKIERDALTLILSKDDLELSSALQEAEKLICYAFPNDSITAEDVKAIGVHGTLQKGWQYSEDIVWAASALISKVDSKEIFPLIGQVRYHLQNGLQIARSIEYPSISLGSSLSKLRLQSLEKYKRLASVYTSEYFRQGLALLTELETRAKSSSIPIDLLWDTFTLTLMHYKKQAAV
ncbi:MAG: hypothetical protein KAR79_04425, partial [Simkaniaceae bacterium]|nr:hypothetical protein [Simkaniaceae bacterium]